MNKNIAFFMYNLSMSKYTLDPITRFLEQDFKITLLHISESTSDRSINITQTDDRYETIDIGRMSSLQIVEILKSRQFISFVFYTYKSKFDYQMLSICNILKIKTILHDHGILFNNTSSILPLKINSSLISRNLRLALNALLLQIKYPKHSIISNLIRSYINNQYFRNVKFDNFIFYSKLNFAITSKEIPVNIEKTMICGFPFFNDESNKKEILEIPKKNKAIYIHQPFINIGMSSTTFEEECTYLKSINTKVNELGLDLVIRLHPSTFAQKYEDFAQKINVKIDTDELVKSCANAKLLIGHWSSALSIGLPLRIPIIIVDYPKLKKEYKKYLSLYNDYCLRINNIQELDLIKFQNYISPNIDHTAEFIGIKNTFEFNAECLKQTIINQNKQQD